MTNAFVFSAFTMASVLNSVQISNFHSTILCDKVPSIDAANHHEDRQCLKQLTDRSRWPPYLIYGNGMCFFFLIEY